MRGNHFTRPTPTESMKNENEDELSEGVDDDWTRQQRSTYDAEER
jgi:hypothetical protein